MIDRNPDDVPLSCRTCPGRELSEWCCLAGQDLELLDRHRTHRDYAPGEVIFRQGAPCLGIYCVESGTVALRKADPERRQVIARLVHPHETLGARTFFGRGTYSTTAEALTAARVCFIDRVGVKELLSRSPALAESFLRRLADDLRSADDEKLEAATLDVRARVARLLLALAERYGEPGPDGAFELELPLARQDMAALIGVRPESVARAVRALEDDRVATFRGRAVTIPDIDRLLAELPAGT